MGDETWVMAAMSTAPWTRKAGSVGSVQLWVGSGLCPRSGPKKSPPRAPGRHRSDFPVWSPCQLNRSTSPREPSSGCPRVTWGSIGGHMRSCRGHHLALRAQRPPLHGRPHSPRTFNRGLKTSVNPWSCSHTQRGGRDDCFHAQRRLWRVPVGPLQRDEPHRRPAVASNPRPSEGVGLGLSYGADGKWPAGITNGPGPLSHRVQCSEGQCQAGTPSSTPSATFPGRSSAPAPGQ